MAHFLPISNYWQPSGLSRAELEAILARHEGHRRELLADVRTVPVGSSVPASVAILGQSAFCVFSSEGDEPGAVVAAAEYGRGRVVVFAHEALVDDLELQGDAIKLRDNAKAWVQAAPGRQPEQPLIMLKGCPLDSTGSADYPTPEALAAWVYNGGALIIAICTWGWPPELERYAHLGDELPMNKVLYPMGLALTAQFCGPPPETGTWAYTIANSDPLRCSVWAFINQVDEKTQTAVRAPSKGHPLSIGPGSVVAVSAGDLADAAVVFGGPPTTMGGWWCPVGEPHWVEVRIPEECTHVSGVDLMCANVNACPVKISVAAAETQRAAKDLVQWDFEREAGAAPLEPVLKTLAHPVRVGESKIMRVGFHGIRNSHYIGINKLALYGIMSRWKLAGSHLVLALAKACPSSENSAIAAFVASHWKIDCAPTPLNPMTARGHGRTLLALANFAPSIITREIAPFPGAAAETTERGLVVLEASVVSDAHHATEWISTNLYASPGDIITATVIQGNCAGWHLRIGCHSDNIAQADTWKRWPDITQAAALLDHGAPVVVTATYGGPIFIAAKSGEASPIRVLVTGGVAAPHANVKDGCVLVDGPAPWGELVGERIILTLRRESLLKYSQADLLRAITFWDAVVASHHKLAPPPYGSRRERVVPDVQTVCGLMHSGYPIMVDEHVFNGCSPRLSFQDSMLNITALTDTPEGHLALWGILHELGHNHQSNAWTWSDTTEVTVNLFTLFTLDQVVRRPIIEAYSRWTSKPLEETAAMMHRLVGTDAYGYPGSFTTWRNDPAVALVVFAALANRFGWDFIKNTMAAAAAPDAVKLLYCCPCDLPEEEQPAADAWVIHGSKVAGYNLAPVFLSWGVPISTEAQNYVASYPPL